MLFPVKFLQIYGTTQRLAVNENAVFHAHDPVHHSGQFGIMGGNEHADASAVG